MDYEDYIIPDSNPNSPVDDSIYNIAIEEEINHKSDEEHENEDQPQQPTYQDIPEEPIPEDIPDEPEDIVPDIIRLLPDAENPVFFELPIINLPLQPIPVPVPLEQVPAPSQDNDYEIETQSISDVSNDELNYDSDGSDNTGILTDFPILPCQNFARDIEYPEDDEEWERLEEDDIWNVPPLPLLQEGGELNIISQGRQPEDFFEALFDEQMWTSIADETNRYASTKKRQLGPCPVTAMDSPDYRRFARMNRWKSITEDDLKVFVAHLLLMGILRKSEIEKYWCKDGVAQTPFFGQFMARNRFTSILSNFHVFNDSMNPPFGSPGHDPLSKIRPFVKMCEDNFKFAYTPLRDLSMDESCCPWKGRLRFKVYNPRKPARFHIKLFQLCEAKSGYILGFSVYTGQRSCVDPGVCEFDECTKTTKIVMTLMNRCDLLDKGYRVFFDNYYTSPELLDELLHRNTLSCGTVRKNRKGMPQAIKLAKLKPGETCFRRSKPIDGGASPVPGSMLAIKWCDKREVTMISTSHAATEQWTGRLNRTTGNPIYKPSCIVEYIHNMGGVDLSDQLMTYYSFLRKTVKWWRKLWVHMLNMLMLNAYILNKKFGEKKLSHSDYREYIAGYLIRKARNTPEVVDIDTFLLPDRLFGRHWPMKLPKNNSGIIVPLHCKVCFVGERESRAKHKPKNRKSTSYKCQQCNLAMCIDPCFRIYHVEKNYKDFV